MSSKQALLRVAALTVLALAVSARAEAQFVTDTTIRFETECGGAAIPDSEFAGGTADRLDLSATRFLSCGIESINSPGSGGIGFADPQLHRPSLGNLTVDAISGVANGTALVGASDITTLRDLIITFVTPVNELGFRVLDVDAAARLTIELRAADNSISTLPFTLASGVATIDQDFPNGVKSVTFKYDEQGNIDNWGVDDLRFNTWDCGDGEPEGAPANEACDDGDDDYCDTCGTDCTVTINGCFDNGSCFADGEDRPGSAGCAVCELGLAPPGNDDDWRNAPLNKICDDGLFCVENEACGDGASAGTCVGTAVDCDDGAVCSVDSCNEATDQCDNLLAVGCLINGACISEGQLKAGNSCLQCSATDNQTDWSPVSAGTACGDPSCSAGVLTPAPLCDASATCVGQSSVSCDGAICADSVSCTGECQNDAECLSTNHCEDGMCIADSEPGATCTRAGQCASGFCADGVCCDLACDRVCEACNVGGKAGMCTGYAAGSDPENECPEAQLCASAGLCVPEDRPNGTECDSDAVCASGHCADGFCCDNVCTGECEACNIMGAFGSCTFQTAGTDPDLECGGGDAVCGGAGECVTYETRGNGLCSVGLAPRSAPFWLGVLTLIGLAFATRRRRQGS